MHALGKGLWAVIVADIIGSGRTRSVGSLLAVRLRAATSAHLNNNRIRLPYAVTAGDEFQTVAADLLQIPDLLFDLRRHLHPLQLRIGVGIGAIPGPLRPPVNQLSGPAFERARAAIEESKNARAGVAKTTCFQSANPQFDLLANLIYSLHDALVGSLSEKQWRTVDAYMEKGRVDLAARSLKIDASTASRNLSRGHLWESLETIAGLKKLIASSFR